MGAFWIALVDRPGGPTIDDWRLKANGTCQRDFGEVQVSISSALLELGQAAARPTRTTRTS